LLAQQSGCNRRRLVATATLPLGTRFKVRLRSAFEAYQLALRRVLQAHQTRQSSLAAAKVGL